MLNTLRKVNFAKLLGRRVIGLATELGKMTRIVTGVFYWSLKGRINLSNTVDQMLEVGWKSFPVIALTSLFTGMVLALQTGTSFRNLFNEPIFIGMVVGFSLVKELGPVLTAIVLSGRVGAFIAAEIGTMNVTEQLDALYTLGTNPVRYLAVPRFVACLIMIPLLTVMANVIGIVGGQVISLSTFHVPSSVYYEDILNNMEITSLFHGLIKSFVFSGIIVTTSCYEGFYCQGGAEGVGKATTNAVMISMVMILISDYFLTALLVALRIT